jgi:hypothetical protein
MALPATHIRFALDSVHRFPITYLDRYIAGTLYPDSRWLTGVDRLKSHDQKYLTPEFPDSEYTYGIHIHCVCDKIQSLVFAERLPGLADLDDQDRWVYLSAAKMIQDSFDMQEFDLQACLPFLAYAENPNDEDVNAVLAFNRIIQNAYRHKKRFDFQDYFDLWVHVSLSPDTAAQMVSEMKRMAEEDDLVQLIKKSYGETFRRVESLLNE